ncbi:hypothetical protein B0H17DRAFT_51598 [Mycena rosella]|uniref:Transmembrane protein n=1 Tax=Mycena rosella TaxID=1033263 RepID=A0AAD7GER6_MYCRO|nr:hypothetical protein B0H17DRAFT_51598 [Mycena rosella]
MSVSLCLSRAIFSYRLGYTPQHPYPWRWMTPIAICVFLMLSGFLAALNVPLSAYNIDQEFTYRPNDTLPPLPLSNMLPELLQHPTNGFTPQILAVGDVIQLNNSVFNYTIMEAFDALDNSQPVSSFSYYNNPFSDGCDVTNMTVNLAIGPDANNDQVIDLIVDFTVSVNCRIPTLFTMIWSGTRGITSIPLQTGINPARDDFNNLSSDMGSVFLFWPRPSVNTSEIPDGGQLTTLRVTVLPCCNCGVDSSTEPAGDDSDPTQAPCGLLPARLQATQLYIEHSAQPIPVTFDGPNSTDIFSGLPSTISDYFNNTPVSALNDVFQNTFQSLYHLARMELGVIVENQIYASPEMYNNSISPVYIPGFESSTPVPPSNYLAANTSRISTSNATLMSEWIASVRSFNESDRVPVMLYPRSVPRLKPLGSAITSVFVSTFAMLSTLWTIFSMVAAALARSYAGKCASNLLSLPG